MTDKKSKSKAQGKTKHIQKLIMEKPEKTVVRTIGLMGALRGGVEGVADIKDGKIVRIRPLHYDWKYDKEQFNPWKFQRNGVTLEPLMKSLPGPFSLAYKKRVYSPNRIKFPLKRVDWDPNGERNTQNRGKSKYQRISWDEAAEIVASEIKRIHKTYGQYAILAQADGHAECKKVHAPHGAQTLLLEKLGCYTLQIRNPDSWEGWYWGSRHVWGIGNVGMMDPADNIVKDMTENCDMLLFWGADPETTGWGFAGQFPSRLCYFWSKAGIKQVYICPELNYAAAIHADKWIPILPNTDAALQLAIIYMWITEGTYDKKYVATHTIGMDKVEAYVLGKEDGIPKTPEWASKKCGVPEWTIKALAREFAVKTTSIVHNFGGGLIRGPYSHEPARLECILLGMQGLGGPGVHQYQVTWGGGMPRSKLPQNPPLALDPISINASWNDRMLKMFNNPYTPKVKQKIPRTLIQEAILNPPLTFYGTSAIAAPPDDQFVKFTYPIPKEEGGTEIHMIWTDCPCRTTCWNDGNKTIQAMRSPKIECIVAQHQWLENDCLIADIILPVNTYFEVEDMMENMCGGQQFFNVVLYRRAIEPIGESKSDYEAVLEVAKKLGMYEVVTEGKTVEDWIKHIFNGMGMSELISWEDFKEKQYYVFATAEDWENDPPGFRKFYQNPKANPLPTPSGKLEFYSERLAKHFPNDEERPPIPKWIEKGITHDERLSSERARKYSLLQMSNHGRWRMHSQCDDISWTREVPTCKIKGPDGYMYEPLWINPSTAAQRGIKNGDLVKSYNERGAVLGAAYVTERIMPGVVYMDHGARVDYIVPEKVDRGGAINLISPTGTTSRNCAGMASSGYLVEVEKVSMAQIEEWRQKYPEAFGRDYDPASGLRFDAWVEGGM